MGSGLPPDMRRGTCTWDVHAPGEEGYVAHVVRSFLLPALLVGSLLPVLLQLELLGRPPCRSASSAVQISRGRISCGRRQAAHTPCTSNCIWCPENSCVTRACTATALGGSFRSGIRGLLALWWLSSTLLQKRCRRGWGLATPCCKDHRSSDLAAQAGAHADAPTADQSLGAPDRAHLKSIISREHAA